jgi:hypothetical protein
MHERTQHWPVPCADWSFTRASPKQCSETSDQVLSVNCVGGPDIQPAVELGWDVRYVLGAEDTGLIASSSRDPTATPWHIDLAYPSDTMAFADYETEDHLCLKELILKPKAPLFLLHPHFRGRKEVFRTGQLFIESGLRSGHVSHLYYGKRAGFKRIASFEHPDSLQTFLLFYALDLCAASVVVASAAHFAIFAEAVKDSGVPLETVRQACVVF